MYTLRQMLRRGGKGLTLGVLLCVSAKAKAQGPWIDAIPRIDVGCLQGNGKPGSIDFSQLLRTAKTAGFSSAGNPFLNKIQKSSDAETPVDWEMCVSVKGNAQEVAGFQLRTMPESPAAFQLCQGSDIKSCASDLLTCVRTKIPDYAVPLRTQPLCMSPDQTLTQIKANLSKILTEASPILLNSTSAVFPVPQDDLDKKLYGISKEPRPLLRADSQIPGGASAGTSLSAACTAVVVIAPLDTAQKALLGVQ